MMKKISQISFAFIFALMLLSCKNTKQKLQEYVATYNSTAASFKAENVTLTTARGYINDNKIELRFETNLEQNESNKTESIKRFSDLLREMLNKDQIPKELVDEGVQFDVYFLADDNTVFVKEVVNAETMPELIKK
ncbi:hypothetical protein SD960_13430 [Flavobacterium sp. MMLR14_040]|uniref:hypothetical protein n=1 Tax=Flavobacterium sp. MMLR14_040 TaxID=3093843 RepID=UPI00298FE0B2|nr:hypothetical protein [Flavobacterium sp. MMLR14_040]MDW8851101.1 hypothetical protein [Flavobacterium sp. MMLR14_040]